MNWNFFRCAMNKINVTRIDRRRPKVGGNGIWKYAEMMSQNRTEENEEFIVSSVSMYFYNVHFLLLQIIFCDGDENLWLISLLFNFIVDWQICFDDLYLYLNVNCSVKEFLLHQLYTKCWTYCESCLLKKLWLTWIRWRRTRRWSTRDRWRHGDSWCGVWRVWKSF